MSPKGNGQSVPYEVLMSGQDRSALLQFHRKAMLKGTSKQFVSALRRIYERLRKDPQVFGEPLYRLPLLHLQVRQAVILPLEVQYAVHEERPLVFIRSFKVLS
jgi:hypothetical protein